MLKTLFFSLLLQLGWAEKQTAWVQQVKLQELTCTAERIAKPILQSRQSFPGPLWQQAAMAHGVDPVLLYSVALFESGRCGDKKKGGPWPFALHFNNANVSIYALSAKEAKFVLAHVNTDNVDIGLGQVNYKSHKEKVHRPEDLLDPKTNLNIASQILAEAINSTVDQELGVGRYHSWTEWRARAYGRKVLTIYQALKGFLEKHEAEAGLEGPPNHG